MRSLTAFAMLVSASLSAPALADDFALRNAPVRRVEPLADGAPFPAEDAWAAAATIGQLLPVPRDAAPAGMGCEARALFDDDALHLRIVARGRPSPTYERFAGERLQAVLDPRNEHRSGLVVEAPYGAPVSAHPVGEPSTLKPELVRGVSERDGDAWIVTLAIPWEALAISPEWRSFVGFDLLRLPPEPHVAYRWSPATTSRDPDLARTGLLLLGDPPIEVESVSWPALHLGVHEVKASIRNRTAEPVTVRTVCSFDSPFGRPSETTVRTELAGYGRTDVSLPLTIPASGGGVLSLEAALADGTTPLFSTRYAARSDGRLHVAGVGWMELTPLHRLAGHTPVTARLRALECRPRPASQPPVTLSVSLVGPIGAGETEYGLTRERMDAIELSVLDRDYAWDVEDLLPGTYQIVAGVHRGEAVLGECRHIVRVSRLLEEDLGLVGPAQALERLRDPNADITAKARRGSATLAHRLDRAWRILDATTATTEEELRGPFDQVRAETAEAARVAADLERGLRPYDVRPGSYLLAHWSEVDGSAQPYGLYAPDSYSDARGAGLVLMLHGWSGAANAGMGAPGGDADPLHAEARKRGWLVLYPFGRGNNDWRDAGETDLLDLLDELALLYSIDPSRVYLAGVSMGGRGTWRLAARHPDRWAGIIPIAGASKGQIWTVWEEERLAPNYLNVPAYIVHGAKDDTVPIEDARAMYRKMLERGYDVALQEYSERGHEGFGDFSPTLFAWMDSHKRDLWPRRVRYATEWLRWPGAYWARIDGLEREGAPAALDAEIAGATRVEVLTEGVTRFTLKLAEHPLLDARRVVTVEVDGSRAFHGYLPPSGALSFAREDGLWSTGEYALVETGPAPPKSPFVCGPMRRAYGDRFRLVFGTRTWDDARILAAYDMARRASDRWREWMWGENRPLRDTDLAPEAAGDGSLLLFGGPDLNLAARPVTEAHPEWPWGDLTGKLSFPNPANPARLSIVFAAPTGRALTDVGQLGNIWPLPPVPPVPLGAQDADYQICAVDSEARLIPALEGTADDEWSPPASIERVLVSTDRTWRASHIARDGWTDLAYDDGAWLAPDVRLRKMFDESSWHYASLHKYGRLVHSFAPPTMALTARDDPDLESEPTQLSYFRKTFDLDAAPERALLRAYLDDEGEVFLNGRRVMALGYSDGVTEIDVAEHLQVGANVLAVRLLNTHHDQCLCLELLDLD